MELKSHLYLLPCLSALTGRKIVSICHFVYLLDIAVLAADTASLCSAAGVLAADTASLCSAAGVLAADTTSLCLAAGALVAKTDTATANHVLCAVLCCQCPNEPDSCFDWRRL